MPFWVYGLDSQSRQPTDPFYSQADDEEVARAEATSQGIIVEAVERQADDDRALEPSADAQMQSGEQDLPKGRVSCGFSSEQISVIKSLAWYMRVVGVMLIFLGVLQLWALSLGKGFASWPNVAQGLLQLIVGALTAGVAGSFRKVVNGRGGSVDHLVDALSGLRLLFAIQTWIAIVAFAIIAVAVLSAVAR